MFNPYTSIMPDAFPFQPQQTVVKVNGENGARAYNLPANSSSLLLDENGPVIYLLQTDGAGYKTVTAFDIIPHAEPEKIELNDILTRIERLEGKLYESNITSSESADKTTSGGTEERRERMDQECDVKPPIRTFQDRKRWLEPGTDM